MNHSESFEGSFNLAPEISQSRFPIFEQTTRPPDVFSFPRLEYLKDRRVETVATPIERERKRKRERENFIDYPPSNIVDGA